MPAPRQLKSEILKLRNEGKSYRDIQSLLNCSKGTVNYHCKRNNLTDTGMKLHRVSEKRKSEIFHYCKEHTCKKASAHFGLCLSTIKAYRKYQPLD